MTPEASRAATSAGNPQPTGPDIGDAAAWSAAEEATRTGREQLRLILAQPEVLSKIHERFANVGEAQQAGHYFEWQQELTFNLDAIIKSADVRARTTEWLGEPHAPADLRLIDPSGHVLSEVQAKVVASAAQRLSPVDGLAAEKYDGMQLVVPSDHVAGTQDLIDRRLRMPAGPLHERYQDVNDRLGDHVSHGDVSAQPIADADLRRLVNDPGGYLDGLASHNHIEQLIHAGAAAGLAVGVVSAATILATSAVRDRSLQGLPWMEAAIRAARRSVRATAVVAGGQGLSLAAQHAVATGTGGAAAHAVAGGTLPYAIARGSLDIAVAAHGFATGRLSAGEAAAATANAITRNAAVWACSAIGQTVIPIPVVGAIVGGAVGQVGAAMVVKGVQLAVMARAQEAVWDASYQLLLQRTVEVQAAARAEMERLTRLQEAHETAFAQAVLPLLAEVSATMGTGRVDKVLDGLGELTRRYAGTPLFTTMAEFDVFMTDERAVLTLDLGAPEGHA